jgi:hypothetical protein
LLRAGCPVTPQEFRMKAEERKHLKENELAERLGRAWRTVASGSTTSTIIWGVILVGLALAIGWRYYSNHAFQSRSAEWSAVERADKVAELEQIAKDHPGTVVGRVAQFHLNRYQMAMSLAQIAGPSGEERVKAADTLATVRDSYADLAKQMSDEPELVEEALMGVAKADEVLAGVPKADNPKEPRESLDTAQQAYAEVARRFPGTYFGEQAAKRAKELEDDKLIIRAFYNGLMDAHSPPAAGPILPPAPPPAASTPAGPALPEAPKAVPPEAVPPVPPAGTSPEAPKEPKPKAP